MCGIAGFVNKPSYRTEVELKNIIMPMADVLGHRGPDDKDSWIDEKAGIALGHRRLSIIDTSKEGRQPMVSGSGRYVIILNGEIYNFKIIRHELESYGYKFRGHSDTEVAVAAIEHWGPDRALTSFNGMFAFALWDAKERILRLARDRLGEKPLYYGYCGRSFIFASELKAFHKHPDFKAEVDRNALALYLQYAYIPAPYSIYKGIFKLLPGHMLEFKDFQEAPAFKTVPYWSIKKAQEHGLTNRYKGSIKEAVAEVELLVRGAVGIRMESDVPLGVFLSGGIDSSLITALMQSEAKSPVKTFTIGFCEKSFNEALKARRIAAYLKTDHTELYIRPEDSLSVIPLLSDIYDEPFADSSQIPTFLISKLTRKYVTVALSGDAGDEVFGGYNRYFWGAGTWNKIKWMPYSSRKILAQLLKYPRASCWDCIGNIFSSFLSSRHKQLNWGTKIYKLAKVIDANNQKEVFSKLISFWQNPYGIVRGSDGPLAIKEVNKDELEIPQFSEWMMFNDLTSYLPDDILVKVDRASMAVGLEARAVFLDHRIVEFAFSIPPEMKIRTNSGKIILKSILNKYVPSRLFDFPKTGFSLPLDYWLAGPLRPWAESLLGEKMLEQDGFFNPEIIRKKWKEYLGGARNWQQHIWIVLMFQAWKQRWC